MTETYRIDDYQRLLRESWSEDQFLRAVIALAEDNGFLVHHERPARTAKGWRTPVQGHAGYPDLTLAADPARRAPGLLVLELKVAGRKPTGEQEGWLACLRAAGIDARIVYPQDWDDIVRILT